jgi:hypothetical protein
MKLMHNEVIPATAQLGGIDDTHCGDAAFSQSASLAAETHGEAFTLRLQK